MIPIFIPIFDSGEARFGKYSGWLLATAVIGSLGSTFASGCYLLNSILTGARNEDFGLALLMGGMLWLVFWAALSAVAVAFESRK